MDCAENWVCLCTKLLWLPVAERELNFSWVTYYIVGKITQESIYVLITTAANGKLVHASHTTCNLVWAKFWLTGFKLWDNHVFIYSLIYGLVILFNQHFHFHWSCCRCYLFYLQVMNFKVFLRNLLYYLKAMTSEDVNFAGFAKQEIDNV